MLKLIPQKFTAFLLENVWRDYGIKHRNAIRYTEIYIWWSVCSINSYMVWKMFNNVFFTDRLGPLRLY